jgi:quercetin dioxygenase-like cupin family protein
MPAAQTMTARQSASGHKFIEGTLDKPLLHLDLISELGRLREDESWKQPAGRSSKTLVKHPDLRIVLIAMKANTRMHEHTAAGRISVQTLSGHVRLHLPGQVVELPAGHLLALDECVPHDVEAAEESAFLLTLSWPPEAKAEESQTRRKTMLRRKRK